VRAKALVCGRSTAGIVGSSPAGGEDVSLSLSLVSVVCYQVEVSETGQSLVQRSLTECVSVIEEPHWGLSSHKENCIRLLLIATW